MTASVKIDLSEDTLLVGIAATVSDDPKWVLLALLPLFVGGGVLLSVVREEQARSATVN